MKLTGAMKNINVTLVITYGLLVGISIGIIISFVLYILCRNNETESTTPENINKKRNPRWCKDKSWLWLWTPLVLGIIFGTFGGYTYGKGYNLATMYSLIGFIIGISAPLITSAIIIISSCNN
jgi:H+/gluconate symporter-like permease